MTELLVIALCVIVPTLMLIRCALRFWRAAAEDPALDEERRRALGHDDYEIRS